MKPECPYCHEKVDNLMQHMVVCPKRVKEPTPKRAVVPAVRPVQVVKSIEVKRHPGGRPRQHETCRICGGLHHAKGLCKACYSQEYNAKS